MNTKVAAFTVSEKLSNTFIYKYDQRIAHYDLHSRLIDEKVELVWLPLEVNGMIYWQGDLEKDYLGIYFGASIVIGNLRRTGCKRTLACSKSIENTRMSQIDIMALHGKLQSKILLRFRTVVISDEI